MTNDLDLALREAADDLHLDVPLTDVMSRGTRIRRRRQGVRIGVAGTALAVTAGVATIVLPPGSSPLPAAEAGWGPQAVNLSDADLTAAKAECATMLAGAGHDVPADAAPVLADSRGRTTFLVYRVGDVLETCSLFQGTEGWVDSGPWETITPGKHLDYLTGGGLYLVGLPKELVDQHADGAWPSGPPDPSETVRVLRVSDDVARVVVHDAGRDIEARVADGLAVSWAPDGATDQDLFNATMTAYAADGTELDRVSFNWPEAHLDEPGN